MKLKSQQRKNALPNLKYLLLVKEPARNSLRRIYIYDALMRLYKHRSDARVYFYLCRAVGVGIGRHIAGRRLRASLLWHWLCEDVCLCRRREKWMIYYSLPPSPHLAVLLLLCCTEKDLLLNVIIIIIHSGHYSRHNRSCITITPIGVHCSGKC